MCSTYVSKADWSVRSIFADQKIHFDACAIPERCCTRGIRSQQQLYIGIGDATLSRYRLFVLVLQLPSALTNQPPSTMPHPAFKNATRNNDQDYLVISY